MHIAPLEIWSGRLPTAPRYFLAACDDRFFIQFAPALAMSAYKTDNPIHLHCINPSSNALDIADRCNRLGLVSATWCNDPTPSWLEGKAKASYYANFRLHMLPQMLKLADTQRVVVIDFDSVFNGHYDMQAPEPIGLYLRDKVAVPAEQRHRYMVCCSMLWVDEAYIDYAAAVSNYIASHALGWCLDQEAVYACARDMGLLDVACDISKQPGLCDWDFTLKGMLWTGKGSRKAEANVFTGRSRKLAEAFWSLPFANVPAAGSIGGIGEKPRQVETTA